jgi:CBS domain-containing protein
VKDLLIPLEHSATIHVDKPLREAVAELQTVYPLREAVAELQTVYCEIESGKCTEAGHRTSLVLDENDKLVGILDFQAILKVLIPEISGSLSQKLQAIGVSIAFAEGDTPHLDESNQKFRERVIKNAETKVSDIMLKLRGKNATIDMTLVDALNENDKLIGILRDSDLFLATASILTV